MTGMSHHNVGFNSPGVTLGISPQEIDDRARNERLKRQELEETRRRLDGLPGTYVLALTPDQVYYAWTPDTVSQSRNLALEDSSLSEYLDWLVGAGKSDSAKRFYPFGEAIKRRFINTIGGLALLCYPQLQYLWLSGGGDSDQSADVGENIPLSAHLAKSVTLAPPELQKQLPNSFEIAEEQVRKYRGLIGSLINPVTGAVKRLNDFEELTARLSNSRQFKAWLPIVEIIRRQFTDSISSELRGQNDPFRQINYKWYYQPELLIQPINRLVALGAISLGYWPGVLSHIADVCLKDSSVPVNYRDEILTGFVNAGLEQELRKIVGKRGGLGVY